MARKKKEEEKKMAEIVFRRTVNGSDAVTPAQTPWGVAFRTTLPVDVPAATRATGEPGRVMVRLGYTCNVPLIVWAHDNVKNMASQALRIVSPGEELTILLENDSDRAGQIFEKTTVLCAAVLPKFDFDVV